MTVEEKRKALTQYCEGKPCDECPLCSEKLCRCGNGAFFEGHKVGDKGYMSDAEIIGAYELAFGKDEIETEELK